MLATSNPLIKNSPDSNSIPRPCLIQCRANSSARSTTTAFQFGRYPLGNQVLALDGRMDEITLVSRALDATKINAVKNFKVAGTESGLIAYWPFDNASWTTMTDATGHGH